MKDKDLALQLLLKKQTNSTISFTVIRNQTGYSKRHLIRMAHSLEIEKDMDALLQHANKGKEPHNKT